MKSDGDEYNDEYMSNFGIQRSTYRWAPLKYTNTSKFSLMEFKAFFSILFCCIGFGFPSFALFAASKYLAEIHSLPQTKNQMNQILSTSKNQRLSFRQLI